MSVSYLGSQAAQSGAVSSSRPAFATSSATAHVKGSWTQLISSTSYPAAWVLVEAKRAQQPGDYLFDIGVGGAGSEQVVIANVPYSNNLVASPPGASYLFPLFIPSGSRIAVRHQNNTALAATLDVQLTVFAPMLGGERGLGQVETCGANTGTSLGTTIPGNTTTAHTKGSWTQLIASTSFAYKWVCLGIMHTNIVSASSISHMIDIGVGAGGSEVVVVPNIFAASEVAQDSLPSGGRSFPLAIPAGTRIAARCQASLTTALERDVELVLLGVG